LIKYLSNEFEYLPWNTFIKRLNYYIDMIESTEIYGDFNNYILELVKPIYDTLKWENDDTKIDTWLNRFKLLHFKYIYLKNKIFSKYLF
jgi:hypothetical protein